MRKEILTIKDKGSLFVDAAVQPSPAVRIIAAPEKIRVFETLLFKSSKVSSGLALELVPAYIESRPRITSNTPITATVIRTHFLSQTI